MRTLDYNKSFESFKKSYEEKHQTVLTHEQAKFEFFKQDAKHSCITSGIFTLIFIGVDIWLIFFYKRFNYYVVAWILIAFAALISLCCFIGYCQSIGNYQKKLSADKKLKPMTRTSLANEYRYDAFDLKVDIVYFVILCICAASALIFHDTWLGSVAIFIGILPAICIIIIPFDAADRRKKRRRILNSDFLFFSAALQNKHIDLNGNSECPDDHYLSFGGRLPLGHDLDKVLASGDYKCSSGTYDNMEVGKTYYLVLLKDKKMATKGIECYDLCDAYPADEWLPDDELRQIMLEG